MDQKIAQGASQSLEQTHILSPQHLQGLRALQAPAMELAASLKDILADNPLITTEPDEEYPDEPAGGDEADDREAGKRTSVVAFGKQAALVAYLFNGFIGFAVMAALWLRMFFTMPLWTLFAPAIYLILHTLTWLQLRKRTGKALNPLLGATARNMLIFTILLLIPLILYN